MESFVSTFFDHINRGIVFAQAIIIDHHGSAPRTSGSRMLVRKDRTICGTIGGGIIEARVIDECIRLLDTSCSRIMEFSLDRDAKQGMDMICGGQITVWIQTFVPPVPEALSGIYKRLCDMQLQGQKAMLISRIRKNNLPETWLHYNNMPEQEVCTAPFAEPLWQSRDAGVLRKSHGQDEFIVEFLNVPEILFIVGAGHVGYQLAKIADIAGFSYVVIDDRPKFANADRFPNARAVHVTGAFSTVFEDLHIDEKSYIVIMTRGHLHDQTVLEQALQTKAAYIGMIGSRKKKGTIYQNLKDKGVDPFRLEQVHSPIGLEIKAETPGEIAVSIMGELILSRAKSQKRFFNIIR